MIPSIWNKIKTALNKILGIKFGDEYARTLINQINRYVRHGQMSSDVSMLSMADNLNRLNKEAELRFATDDAATLQSQVGQAQMHGRTSISNRDIYGKAIEQAGGIARVWEFIKRKLSTLDNLALYSEGLQKVFTISQKQGTFSNMLLSKYEEMTDFVRNIVGGPNTKEREIANMMLAYASMYRKYEFDKIVAKLLEGKSGIERYNLIRFFVVDPVTGDVVPNKAFQDRIKKLGRMTPEDFKKGFNIPFGDRDSPAPVSIHEQMLKSGIDLKTFDPDNNASHKKIWMMFTQHNSAVTQASIDLVESNYFAFYEGVIKSKARLTYGQVYNILEGNEDLEDSPDVNSNLLRLFDLYKTLAEARSKRGAIDFDTVETRIIFDDFRKIEKIVPIERNYAHRLIEECMLCANLAAATFLESNNVPTLYRVHEGPTAEKLVNLRLFLSELGLDLKGGEKPSPMDYQRILAQVERRQDSSIIQIMLLRSLKQAVYQPDNKGHFGLNYTTYSHFTSPIRRYPDLLVHRAIRSIIVNTRKEETHNSSSSENKKKYSEKLYPYDLEKMIVFGEKFSMTERRADDATREVQQWLKCEYLSNRIGMKYSGTVSGVANFGLFIELKDIHIDGLLHVTSLPRDYYAFDASRQRLSGERTGMHFSIGDQLEVLVAMVNLEDKKIDLELASKSKELRKRNNKKGKHKKINNSRLKLRNNAVVAAN